MEGLFGLLGQLEAWHWLAIGLALLIAELATGSTYLLWPAVAAWLVGLLILFLPLGWPIQMMAFAGITIGLTLTGRTYVKGRWVTRGGDEALNDRARALVGARAVAAGPFVHGVGRVRLGDSEWRAQCAEPVADGEALEVVSVEGATLSVRKPRALPTS